MEGQGSPTTAKDGNEGHIALLDDESDIVRHLVDYFYLLDYCLIDPASEDSSSQADNSDTASVRTDAVIYGNVYGTSAVSAFGGPAHGHPNSPFSTVFRQRADSTLTVHAIPNSEYAGGFGPRKRKSTRNMVTAPPDPSPLATQEPHLNLHARMYAAGHRYGVDGLKALALDKFKIQLTRHWHCDEFAQAIHVVYTTTPAADKDMREAVANCLGWHARLLDKPEIERAVCEINGLAFELLKRSRRAEPEYMD